MSEEKININPGIAEVTILKGDAPKQPSIVPNQIQISGNLKAPGVFWRARHELYDYDDCHVEYSKASGEIALNLDITTPYPGKVIGKLVLNPDLEAFRIGTLQCSPKELAKFLKMKRAFFSDKDQHRTLVAELNNLKAKIEGEIEQIQDTRGNKREMIEKKVTTNISMAFDLEMPIYLGYESKKFKVEICLDSTDASITSWMESMELEDLKTSMRDLIFEDELKHFEGLVCIES